MAKNESERNHLLKRYQMLQGSAKTSGVPDLLKHHLKRADEDTIDDLYKCMTAEFRKLKAKTVRQQNPDPDPAELNAQWQKLKGDSLLVAECLWIGSVEQIGQKFGKRQPLPIVTKRAVLQSHQLMVVWLEASLFDIRTSNNGDAHELQLPPTRSGIKELFDGEKRQRHSKGDAQNVKLGYVRTIQAWDRSLKTITGYTPFKDGTNIVQQLKGMIYEFGPNSLNVNDDGWAAQAADAAAELRFQLYEAIRRERWHNKNLLLALLIWPRALWYETLKLTTGYGTSLHKFLGTAAIFVSALAFVYYLNDLLNPGFPALASGMFFCPEARASVTWRNWFPSLVRYLYLAVTNLTSLGSDARLATYCGGLSTEILVIISVGMGYFLLALVASFLYNRLSESN